MRRPAPPAPIRAALLVATCWLGAAPAPADEPGRHPAAASQPAPLCGRLTEHHGLPVLELWGSPTQAGFAHGYLLAREILQLIDRYMLDPHVTGGRAPYEALLLPTVRRQFVWSDPARRELEAMLRGMRRRLGADRVRSRVLERPLRIDDLMAANALADWYGLLCSTFSAWGPLTRDGHTLTARNLDFPSTPSMKNAQLVVIRRGYRGAAGWIGIGWPGLIGVYTAMNDRGVTILMHDAPGLPATESLGFTPRSLICREALESARPETYVSDMLRVLRSRRVMVGNNFHASAPRAADRPPAVVFEYDGHATTTGGVTVREAGNARGAMTTALWCTNHFRLRKPPDAGWRYETLAKRLRAVADEGPPLTPASALDLIRAVRQDITLHSVCFVPHARTMYAYIPAIRDEVVVFKLDRWLRPAATLPAAPAATPGARP